MNKSILISANSPTDTRVSIQVKLQGGNPWFGYIWIDDLCYTIIKGPRSIKLHKTTLGGKY